uniref:Putative secreted protein n=1 Tax=Anopheles marajoara TaxID=58244 RepID=A0A2M4CFR2_9DIPT
MDLVLFLSLTTSGSAVDGVGLGTSGRRCGDIHICNAVDELDMRHDVRTRKRQWLVGKSKPAAVIIVV